MDVLWLLGDEKLIGQVGDEDGDGLALRKGGDEILFAPYGKPMRWVQIIEFSCAVDEETAAGDLGQPDAPFPRRERR